jgi:alkylation response protein AidB-like acyl-CoA dehydrogenase
MQYELEAITESGRRLVALAEELAADFETRADQHDRDGSYPFENIEALKRSGFFTAAIPEACGGLGVESAHDVLVASSRLARGDASVTIGVNMHLANTVNIARSWRVALDSGNTARAAKLAAMMAQLVRSGAVIASAISERDQDLTRPATRAERNGSGWIVNGTKVFGTMAPAASMLSVGLTYTGEDGRERYGFVQVPVGTSGVTINDDWDALGMRASGSGSISLVDVHVPLSALREGPPAGEWSVEFLDRYLISGPLHAAASLGIAEAAVQQALRSVTGRRGRSHGRLPAERPTNQFLAAENAIDLAAMRAVFSRAGTLIDDHFERHSTQKASLAEAHAIYKEAQAAKTFVHQAAIRVVDRAMTMSGGAGYMRANRLSRLYRDVRAGPFMHPFGFNVVFEYIGQVSLGIEPSIN